MTPAEVQEIRGAFSLSQRDLANALNVAPLTVARWEDGMSAPTGLQDEVLRGLHRITLDVRSQKDSERTQLIRGLIILGIGALIFYLLAKQ